MNVGFIKVNVDGTISVQNRIFGMGALVWNHLGEVLVAMACKGLGAVKAEVVEAYSLLRILQWAQLFAFRRIVIESNCATIISVNISETFKVNSSLGLILLNCKALLASFESCRIQHVHRTGNAVAHELVRRALMAEVDEF